MLDLEWKIENDFRGFAVLAAMARSIGHFGVVPIHGDNSADKAADR